MLQDTLQYNHFPITNNRLLSVLLNKMTTSGNDNTIENNEEAKNLEEHRRLMLSSRQQMSQ